MVALWHFTEVTMYSICFERQLHVGLHQALEKNGNYYTTKFCRLLCQGERVSKIIAEDFKMGCTHAILKRRWKVKKKKSERRKIWNKMGPALGKRGKCRHYSAAVEKPVMLLTYLNHSGFEERQLCWGFKLLRRDAWNN